MERGEVEKAEKFYCRARQYQQATRNSDNVDTND